LRETEQPVERIGIGLAERAIAGADLVLWLGEVADCPRSDSIILVHARADMPERRDPPAETDIAVSVTSGRGLDELRAILVARLRQLLPMADTVLMTERQRALIRAAIVELDGAVGAPLPELAVEHLRLALREIDRIVGRADVEGMLDNLFSRFCIGK
jgi:tRNA modification GTPase